MSTDHGILRKLINICSYLITFGLVFEQTESVYLSVSQNNDYESREIIRVDDCINNDCLSLKEKKEMNTRSTEKKIIYEKSPFRLSYITHYYVDDVEVELILNNMRNKPYSSIWFNFSFYNGDKMVGKERINFMSLGVFSEEIEIIDFDDEFDKIEVELIKFKLK